VKWLGFIREHLVRNLTIDLNDFEYSPTFQRLGGLSKAKKVFGREIEKLVSGINERIAA